MSEPKEPSIPLSTVVDWLNAQTARADEDAELMEIADEVAGSEPLDPIQTARRDRKLGGLITRQEMLQDFSDLLQVTSRDAAGEFSSADKPTDTES